MQCPTSEHGARVDLINAIRTPLGFFALALLIVEGVFGAIALSTQGTERTVSMVIMVIGVFVIVAVVAFFAYHRPEALFGSRYLPAKPVESQSTLAVSVCAEQLEAAYARIGRLEKELAEVVSLRSQVLGILGAESADANVIIRRLGRPDEAASKSQVLSVLGQLVHEGVIESNSIMPAGYYRRTQKW